jgi:hypothetical protein
VLVRGARIKVAGEVASWYPFHVSARGRLDRPRVAIR